MGKQAGVVLVGTESGSSGTAGKSVYATVDGQRLQASRGGFFPTVSRGCECRFEVLLDQLFF